MRRKETALADNLGRRIKEIRLQQGLTLNELAARSDVSRAMLSKVERSEKSPTLQVLVRIATGLRLSLSMLLGPDAVTAKVSVVRAKDQVPFVDRDSGFERMVVAPERDGSGIEILRHRIPAGRSSGVLPAYEVPTEKYIVVQSGRLTAHLGDEAHVLAAGDTLHFSIEKPYHLANEGKVPCQYYVFVVRRS